MPVWWYYLLTPAFMIFGYVMRQWFDLFWAYLFVSYGVIPIMDQLLPIDQKNPTLKQITELEKDLRYQMIIYLIVTLDIFMSFS